MFRSSSVLILLTLSSARVLAQFSIAIPATNTTDSVVGPGTETTRARGEGIETVKPNDTSGGSCCFVVQDFISEFYWQAYSVYTVEEIVTAIIRNITVLPTGNITNVQTLPNVETRVNEDYTDVYPYSYSLDPLRPPSIIAHNLAPGPKTYDENLSSVNGTMTVTGGTTIYSPTVFDIYYGVKIIVVSPVTDDKGNIACATNSVTQLRPLMDPDRSRTFTGINSHAQAYYGGYGTLSEQGTTRTETGITFPPPTGTEPPTTTITYIETVTGSQLQFVITNTATPAVVTDITFATPYIRIPPPTETVTYEDLKYDACHLGQDNPQEMWGFLPQEIIDMVISNPVYSAQYPDITKCLPGGPSIVVTPAFLCDHPYGVAPRPTLTKTKDFIYIPSVPPDFHASPTATLDKTAFPIITEHSMTMPPASSIKRLLGSFNSASKTVTGSNALGAEQPNSKDPSPTTRIGDQNTIPPTLSTARPSGLQTMDPTKLRKFLNIISASLAPSTAKTQLATKSTNVQQNSETGDDSSFTPTVTTAGLDEDPPSISSPLYTIPSAGADVPQGTEPPGGTLTSVPSTSTGLGTVEPPTSRAFAFTLPQRIWLIGPILITAIFYYN